MTRIAALLAAGSGTRFDGPTHKLLAPFGGRPLWRTALDHVVAAGFDHIVVVTGAVDLDDHDPADPLPAQVELVHNPDWALGQATSLQVAVAAARALDADAVTVGLADQPFVTSHAWRAIAEAPSTCHIVAARYDGRPGPQPVRLDAEVWPLLPHTGDEGARPVLRSHPEWVCWIDCIGSGVDIDTVEDLVHWSQR